MTGGRIAGRKNITFFKTGNCPCLEKRNA